jgi:hypothetical protein
MDYIKFRTINPKNLEATFKKRLDMALKTYRFLVFENIL